MNDTKSYPVEDSENELIRRIDAAVSEAKENEEWRRAYMTYWTRLQDERDEGIEIGLEKGRDEGRLEKAKATAIKLFKRNKPLDDIAEILEYNVDTVRQWIDAGMAVAK